jgi:molybdate transport system substrate-binding protein
MGSSRSRPLRSAAVLAVCVLLGGPRAGWAQDFTVSVAISLKEAVGDLGREFAARHPGVVLHTNFGGSGALKQQVEAGAPVDVFLSAAEDQMDALERQQLIVPGTRHTFARNRLSVIAPRVSRLTLAGVADLRQRGVERIAIGNPKTVPAGAYAAESLRRLGVWDSLRSKLILGEDVRQVLEYVTRGEVDAGLVYATDLKAREGQVVEAFRLPSDSYPPVRYPAAVIAASRQVALGEAFIALLLGPEGQTVLARRGFLPPAKDDR